MRGLDWFPDWSGKTIVIIASGPSAKENDFSILYKREVRVIGINESWRLFPAADVLYGCDGAWWKIRNGVPEFSGLKVTQDRSVSQQYGLNHISLLRKRDCIITSHGEIGDGGNSGFQAINLAIQFGARGRVVLVGFDMRLDRGVHWHGSHPHGTALPRLNNPVETNLIRWKRALDGAAKDLAALGVEVLNASPVSTLTAYPIVPLERALD